MMWLTLIFSRLAVSVTGDSCDAATGNCETGLPSAEANSGQITSLLQIVFGVIGVIALIMIIIGAFNLVLSRGNPETAAKGRSTIIYAVVGLIIALSAEVIVTFVLNKI